jgi:hypothetical protein
MTTTGRYTDPTSIDRMRAGLCPKCGHTPDVHYDPQDLDDPRRTDCPLVPDAVYDELHTQRRTDDTAAAAEHILTLTRTEVATATYKGKEIQLPRYDVVLDGAVIGTVYRTMLTRERRGKGMRYVYARWQSPGWRRAIKGDRSSECRSRKDGIDDLLMEAGLPWGVRDILVETVTRVR